MSKNTSPIEVAQIGRLVGLRGELKLHIHSDFPEQFKIGKVFKTQKNLSLEIASYNEKRGLILFRGYESREAAACLVNSYLMTTMEATLEECNLEDDELFWFDIIGCNIQDDNIVLGSVKDIERIGDTDYMVIKTDLSLVNKKLSKTFFLPFIERYIVSTDKEKKVIYVQDGLDLLENS
jgi:16S rRNA processing protein RimM